MINTKSALLEWRARAVAQPDGATVLDMEADSLHRYHEKICLLQYADPQGACVIDPLAIEDMSPFVLWLQNAELWMHGADYDMSLLLNTWGVLPRMIRDTQSAARLLGFRQFGLAALLEHYFGITLSKSSQKADWSRRPLTDKMLSYATNDVAHMLALADRLTTDLQSCGRLPWFEELCTRDMQKARERHAAAPKESWRIAGAGKLKRRGLAALRMLWTWRNAEARMQDRPAYMICSNRDLIAWSAALQDRKPLPQDRPFPPHRQQRLRQTIRDFYLLDEDEYPVAAHSRRPEYTDRFNAELSKLQTLRDRRAADLNLEPAFLAPRATLEAIAADRAQGIAELMNWQKEALGLS